MTTETEEVGNLQNLLESRKYQEFLDTIEEIELTSNCNHSIDSKIPLIPLNLYTRLFLGNLLMNDFLTAKHVFNRYPQYNTKEQLKLLSFWYKNQFQSFFKELETFPYNRNNIIDTLLIESIKKELKIWLSNEISKTYEKISILQCQEWLNVIDMKEMNEYFKSDQWELKHDYMINLIKLNSNQSIKINQNDQLDKRNSIKMFENLLDYVNHIEIDQ